MADRSIAVRLSVRDAEQAAAALRKFGKEGQTALTSIERASKGPTKGLAALDRASAGTTSSLRNMGSVASGLGGPVGSLGGRFAGLSSIVSSTGLAVGGLVAGLGALTVGLGKAVAAASEKERALFKVDALLRATSGASGQTTASIDEMSVALARNTLASTEGARAASAMLLTFKSIQGEGFERTLSLAQDLAAVGFGSVQTAALQLAKALEDPATGLTMLRRVGVSFTESQKEAIKAMSDAGDVAGAQSIIFATLEAQVGGAGTAEAGGLAGAFDSLGVNVGLFLETIGEKSGLVDIFTRAINGLADAVEGLDDQLSGRIETRLEAVRAKIAQLEAAPRLSDLPEDVRSRIRGVPAAGASTDEQRLETLRQLRAEESQILEIQRFQTLEARRALEIGNEVQAATAQEQADAKVRKAAAIAATAAEKAAARERAGALKELARLELSVAQAGLSGLELLSVKRDQEVEKVRERVAENVLTAEEGLRQELLLEEKFEKERDALAAKAEEKRAADAARLAATELKKRQRLAEKEAAELRKPFDNAARGIQSAFTDAFESAFEGSLTTADDFGEALLGVMRRVAAEIATLMIIRPVLGQVSGLAGLAGVAGTGSSAAGGGILSGGGGVTSLIGSAGGLSDLASGGASLLGLGGIGAGIDTFGASLGFGFGPAGLSGGPAGVAAEAGAFTSAGLSSVLGAGAVGGLGAGLISNFIGGNQTASILGGASISAIAAIAGLAFPPAAIAGVLAGPLIGILADELFPSGPPSVGPNAGAGVSLGPGGFSPVFFGADNGGSPAAALSIAGGLATSFNAIDEEFKARTGQSLFDTPRGQGAGQIGTFGGQFAFGRRGLPGDFQSSDPVEVIKFAVADVLKAQANAPGLGSLNPDAVFPALLEVLKNDDLNFDELLAGIDGVLASRDALAELFAGAGQTVFDLGDEIQKMADRFGAETLARVAALREEGERFGFSASTVAAGLKTAVEALLAAEEGGEEDLTAIGIALAAVRTRFEALKPTLEEVGLAAGLADTALAGAEAALADEFGESVRRSILGITSPLTIALEDLERAQALRLEDATALGADLVAVERLAALERTAVVERFANGATSSLEALLSELQFGTLGGATAGDQLSGARGSFLGAAAQAAAGDPGALGSLAGLGRSLVGSSREVFASSEGFQADRNLVIRTVEQIIGRQGGDAPHVDPILFGGMTEQVRTGEATVAELGALRRLVAAQTEELEGMRRELRAFTRKVAA